MKKYFLFYFLPLILLAQEEKKLAPDIIAKDIYENEFKLTKFTNKPKIIQFMRVYCGGRLRQESITQFKQLSKFYEKYKNKIVFVTVTLSSCKASDLKKIAEIYGIKWTFINDYADYNLDIFQAYSEYLKNLQDPCLIFVNRKNEIVQTSNYCEEAELEEYIKSLIKTK